MQQRNLDFFEAVAEYCAVAYGGVTVTINGVNGPICSTATPR